jgi:diacylglycerol O-acyltransferase
MDVMSVQDAAFLHIEDANNPMHIGSVAVLEGPAPAYGDLVRLIASKLPLVPRYRQKVRFAPGGVGRPVWVDDPHFQILYHIRHTAVPPPGGRDELRNLAGRVFAQALDRGKPL